MKALIEHLNSTLDWRWLPDTARTLVDRAIAVQQIPAPTFEEALRAGFVASQFAALGLQQVETDSLYNVYGLLPGKNRELPGVMVSAHTDTVFSRDTSLQTRVENDLIYGPGLGDNSMGVAGLLNVAELLQERFSPDRNVWFVANTREEALGDLGGMKAAFARLREQIGCVIVLEGMAFGQIYHAGIAVRRLHITAQTEGGHSWLNFGRPSAIHAIVELGARIAALRPPASPRTTFNIGMIEGGQTINAIATHAGLWLDLRSESSHELARLEDEVQAHVKALSQPGVSFGVEVVGDRPAGSIPASHPLVEGALAALAQVGIKGSLDCGSTDANVPLAAGYPAVTVGITRGGNAHRLDEYIETTPIQDGIHHLILLILAAASERT